MVTHLAAIVRNCYHLGVPNAGLLKSSVCGELCRERGNDGLMNTLRERISSNITVYTDGKWT